MWEQKNKKNKTVFYNYFLIIDPCTLICSQFAISSPGSAFLFLLRHRELCIWLISSPRVPLECHSSKVKPVCPDLSTRLFVLLLCCQLFVDRDTAGSKGTGGEIPSNYFGSLSTRRSRVLCFLWKPAQTLPSITNSLPPCEFASWLKLCSSP